MTAMAVIGLIVTTFVLARRGGIVALFSVCLLVTSIAALPVLRLGSNYTHIGITDAVPTVFTYSTVFLAFGVALFISGRAPLPWMHAIFLTAISVLVVLVWNNELQVAGALHLVTAVMAGVVGSFVGRRLVSPSGRTQFALAVVLLAWILIQLIASAVQLNGSALTLAGTSIVPPISNGRASGTYFHPSVVGKVLTLLLLILLPLLRAIEKRVRILAFISIVLGAVVIALTVSRANAFAYVIVLIMWLFIAGSRVSASRAVISTAAGALLALPFIAAFADRIERDPDGGDRPELLAAGIAQIESGAWLGIGPNSYVESVGRWDMVTATGYPVHNGILLVVAELGIPLAAMFFGPYILGLLRNTPRGLSKYSRPASHALLSVTPALVLLIVSGWGMANREVLPFWFFAISLALASSSTTANQMDLITRDHSRALRASRASPRLGRSALSRAVAERSARF